MSLGNNVTFIGNIVRDVEVRESANGKKFVSLTLARSRNYAKGADEITDFVDVTAFDSTAEFCAKYFTKGQRIGVQGHLATQMRERDNVKYKQTNIIADSFEFIGSKTSSVKNDNAKDMDVATPVKKTVATPQTQAIDESIEDDDLPF